MTGSSDVLAGLAEFIQDAFLVPSAEIGRDTVIREIPGFDSLSYALMISAIADRFGVALDPEKEVGSVGELADAVVDRLSDG